MKTISGELSCGCKVEIRGDELHIYPCSEEHRPVMTDAAKAKAAELGIPYEVRVDRIGRD